jgi:hypothetical protein
MLRSGRVLLVGSYRSGGLHRRHPLRPLLAELLRLRAVEQLELAPFGRVELAEQLEVLSEGPLPPARVEQIYRRSEGNPSCGTADCGWGRPWRRGVAADAG